MNTLEKVILENMEVLHTHYTGRYTDISSLDHATPVKGYRLLP